MGDATRLAREAVWQYQRMLSELYPGFDRQLLDSVIRAMQEKHGSAALQVETAVSRAKREMAQED